jgi:hypothetical protein
MYNTLLFMQIHQCVRDLDDGMPTQLLTEICQSNDLMEELATGAQLKDDVVVLLRFGKINQLDDIRMI